MDFTAIDAEIANANMATLCNWRFNFGAQGYYE